jgi:hypothetical protein
MALSTIDQTGMASSLTSLTLVTPNLGTPSAINLSNSTALPSVALPTGSIVQVVSTNFSPSTISTTSTSLVATGLIASITPQFSSSRILFNLSGGHTDYSGSSSPQMFGSLYRQIASGGYSTLNYFEWMLFGGGGIYGWPHAWQYYDSPNTTSTVYYQPYFCTNSSNTAYFNYASGANSGQINITLMEIR